LYLDGPRNTPERFIVVDPLDLEDWFPSGFCMVLDGMVRNAFFIRERLRKNYRFRFRAIPRNSVFELID
jgi:hypothetical protein